MGIIKSMVAQTKKRSKKGQTKTKALSVSKLRLAKSPAQKPASTKQQSKPEVIPGEITIHAKDTDWKLLREGGMIATTTRLGQNNIQHRADLLNFPKGSQLETMEKGHNGEMVEFDRFTEKTKDKRHVFERIAVVKDLKTGKERKVSLELLKIPESMYG